MVLSLTDSWLVLAVMLTLKIQMDGRRYIVQLVAITLLW